MSARCLVLQHIACEPPGAYEDVLDAHDVELHRVELDEGEPLPDWRGFDAIVAMGGPMSVNDEAEHPWLAAEKALIREAAHADVPVFGVCLGVQLLASSLGARVYAGERQEVGLLPVTLTDEGRTDPVFGAEPEEFVTLQWHGDTFDLPPGATLLASSPAYPNQRSGSAAPTGSSFHLEVSASMAEEWAEVPAYAESLARIHGEGALPRLLEEFAGHREEMLARARALFERWLALSAIGPSSPLMRRASLNGMPRRPSGALAGAGRLPHRARRAVGVRAAHRVRAQAGRRALGGFVGLERPRIEPIAQTIAHLADPGRSSSSGRAHSDRDPARPAAAWPCWCRSSSPRRT